MILGSDEVRDRESLAKKGVWYCEPSNPWKPGGGPCYHPFAREVENSQESGWPSGDTIRNYCPVCGHSWTEELPQ